MDSLGSPRGVRRVGGCSWTFRVGSNPSGGPLVCPDYGPSPLGLSGPPGLGPVVDAGGPRSPGGAPIWLEKGCGLLIGPGSAGEVLEGFVGPDLGMLVPALAVPGLGGAISELSAERPGRRSSQRLAAGE